jgi:hypothetical protein
MKYRVEITYEIPVSTVIEADSETEAIEEAQELFDCNVDNYATSYYVNNETAEEIE